MLNYQRVVEIPPAAGESTGKAFFAGFTEILQGGATPR